MTPIDHRPASHDNTTAYLYFYRVTYGVRPPVRWTKYFHPRDFLHYHSLKYPILTFLVLPFMVISALPHPKIRVDFKGNGVRELQKYETDGTWVEYLLIFGKLRFRFMRSLDGKLLNIVRLATWKRPFATAAVSWVNKLFYGPNFQDHFFRLYFRNKYHPILSTFHE
jgi:hypothetical protein